MLQVCIQGRGTGLNSGGALRRGGEYEYQFSRSKKKKKNMYFKNQKGGQKKQGCTCPPEPPRTAPLFVLYVIDIQ